MQNLTGQVLNKYTILERVGQGGMAQVYRAHQANLKRDVAIKVMHPHLAETTDFVVRFKREATAVAQLRHPHIVQIYDFDTSGEIIYMVMEYINGPTLKQHLETQKRPLSLPEIQTIFLPLVNAVQYAHRQGIIHRDLKPANIMFTEDQQVILTDFGIARLVKDVGITASGAVPGTPGYMSPELGKGEPADERSDIYALGVILYELLTGQLPFKGDTPVAVMMKHLSEPVPPPSQINPHLPDRVEKIMLRALSKEQDDRFQTTDDLGQALQLALSAREAEAYPQATQITPPPAPSETNVHAEAHHGLRLTLFQSFQASLDNQPINTFRSQKGRALLAYLAIEREQPHRREFLAGLLWPDQVERKARRNLSQTLLEVREAIGDRTRDRPFLDVSHQEVSFNAQSDHWVDVACFSDLVTQTQSHSHQALEQCAECLQGLAQAVQFYQGHFLDGFFVSDSDLFETWLVTKREALQQQVLTALTTLSNGHEQARDYKQAQKYTRQRLMLIPWLEEAHCQLMRLLVLSGQRSLALSQYESCAQILAEELGVEPSAETMALYEQIRDGILGPDITNEKSEHEPSETAIVEDVPPPPWASAPFQATLPPPHFVGRADEIAQLQAGLKKSGLVVFALVGMGGVGKTTLTTAVASKMQDDFADGVLWANMASSNPMDVLANWAQVYDHDFSALSDLESRSAAVRGMLTDKQTLLILDNVEAVSTVKPLIPSGTECAVLITTRDMDVAYGLNAQAITLGELSPENSWQLLCQILGEARVQAEVEAAQEICTLLQHLPLAIEIVAQRLKSRPRQRLLHMAVRLHDEHHRLGLKISDQAVRTSFAVSWEGLSEDLQQIFPLLAMFAGRPFNAEAVATIAEIDLFDVEDYLDELVKLSLLNEEAEVYYRQHPLLADFAAEKLGDAPEVHQRFAKYYQAFVQANHDNPPLLEPEWDNISAAIQRAFAQDRWQIVTETTLLLIKPWSSQGRYHDARQALTKAVEASRHLQQPEQEAKLLVAWGEVCLEQNDYEEAITHLKKGIVCYRELEDQAG
ncbi:MAG: protein kinase, partial [Chloroflexota bacterium]